MQSYDRRPTYGFIDIDKTWEICRIIRTWAGQGLLDIVLVDGDLEPTVVDGGTNHKCQKCAILNNFLHIHVGRNFLAHFGLVQYFMRIDDL